MAMAWCASLENKLLILIIQVNQTHCASDEAASGVCKVEIVVDGCSYKASGSVQGGVPVLLELDDSVFRQPVSLTGNLLFFKASQSPQLLSSVAGKKHTFSKYALPFNVHGK